VVAVFTGLVRHQGRVERVERGPQGGSIAVQSDLAGKLRLGDSVAVNGVCLTAVAVAPPRFEVEVMAQTLELTTLGELDGGRAVNLELPVAAGERFDGHLVQGHADGVAELVAAAPQGIALELTFSCKPQLVRYIVPQGSVALDGVSLTVTAAAGERFSVWLIPETQRRTTLGALAVGGRVNLEVDVVAKYVERLLAQGAHKPS